MHFQDQSSLHTYRTEIPNILFELGLKANELAVYLAIKRAAGDKGACFRSLANLADMAGVHEKTLREIKLRLSQPFDKIDKPLIIIKQRIDEKGERTTDSITLTDIWPENFKYFMGVVPKSTPPGTKKYTTVVPKSAEEEEPIKEDHLKKTTTAAPPPSFSVVVFSCLQGLAITQETQRYLCKTFDEATVQQAVKLAIHPKTEVKTTLDQYLKAACEGKWEIPKDSVDVAKENKEFAEKSLSESVIPKDVYIEILNKEVEIGFYSGQSVPSVIEYSYSKTAFKAELIKLFKQYNINLGKDD